MSLSATIIGENPVKLWGLTTAERTRRLALANKQVWAGRQASHADVVVNAGFVFDPLWYRHVSATPGAVLTSGGVPILAHVATREQFAAIAGAIGSRRPLGDVAGLSLVAIEDGPTLENKELRKRFTPFVDRLVPANIRSLERASYFGAYKGVTDLLTKYLWPEWALVLTRIAARLGWSPNQVTTLGFILCLVSMYLFWFGHFWWGMATGLVFMVLDTVDGKLARCTITSSKWGNVFDHGIDLVHPPFWWWAWGVGLKYWGLALSNHTFALVMATIVGGYVVQRLIEGVFMRRAGMMHIHVWRRIDSQFRLITARRNPNMVILFFATLAGRPDLGLIALAWWTLLSCAFHLVRLVQAELHRAQGGAIRSWMEDAE